ncbi:S53 family peptidase [Fodinicola feengrottensis]|uniref:S53 family peptidase n=1 Tax=Fodinicola feengrottensis TaxID=435914 RepID=UPI0031DFCA93
MNKRAIFRVSVIGAMALAVVPAAGTAASAAPARVGIAGASNWTTQAKTAGAVPDSTPVTFGVNVSLRDSAGLQQYVQQVSTPGSSNFRKFLTPQQFADAYAPTADTQRKVSNWLSSQGLQVRYSSTDRTYIAVSGSAAQIHQAFGAPLDKYSKSGRTVTAPSGGLSVPADLGGAIQGVVGLDTSHQIQTTNRKPTATAARSAGTDDGCSNFYGQHTVSAEWDAAPAPFGARLPGANCGYTPQQLATARGITSTGLTGKGITVGIGLWCNDLMTEADTNRWASIQHWPGLKAGQYTSLQPKDGPQCTGPDGEQDLDVQAIHGAAPNANIVYGNASAPQDDALISMFHQFLDANKVDIITNSWGEVVSDVDPASSTAYENVFMQAAAQGVSILFSSGDAGDNSNGNAPKNGTLNDYPASDPLATAVGGTSLGLTNASGSAVGFEQGWTTAESDETNDKWSPWSSGRSAGGGGTSKTFAQPFYQKGRVPAALAGATPHRVYPDLANIADWYAGYRIGTHDDFDQSGNFEMQENGGTSLASPYTAGMVALALESNKGTRLGFLNPLIYAKSHAGLTDIKAGPVKYGTEQVSFEGPRAAEAFNAESLLNQTLHATDGFDNKTGWGVPGSARSFVTGLIG